MRLQPGADTRTGFARGKTVRKVKGGKGRKGKKRERKGRKGKRRGGDLDGADGGRTPPVSFTSHGVPRSIVAVGGSEERVRLDECKLHDRQQ